jgi:peptidoglycan hydrolase-like protein with peptidoglycan-binding domain
MCTACEPPFGRRRFLRRALAGTGVVAVAGSVGELLDPDRATAALTRAAPAPPPPSPFEEAAVGEDGPFPATGTSGAPASPFTVAEGLVQVPNATSVPAPPIVRRAQWGADESRRTNERAYTPIRKLIVHHTASANAPANPAAVVREMYGYHLQKGYTDLGYNFIIDHQGVIYEGRYSRPYGADERVTGEDTNGWGVIGGHAQGMNSAACGIVLIGDFTSTLPTDAAVASLVWLLSWKAARHQIDALNGDPYISLFGARMTTPNIAAHRHVGQTSCPGQLAGLLPAIREQVAKNAGRWPAITIDVPHVVRHELGAAPSAPSSPSAPSAPAAPAPSSPPAGGLLPVPMAIGTTGDAVRTVQRALRRAGIRVGADGQFGNQTRTGLLAFQKAKGIARSGEADLATVSALGLVDPTSSNVLPLPLQAGAKGDSVRHVQRALVAVGRRIAVDGDFGQRTRAAVHQFQQTKSLRATGQVDLRTAAALGLVAATAPATATATAPATPTAPAPAAGSIQLPVRIGMTGTDVQAVQRALRGFGYNVAADGTFGAVTQKAVKRFQKAQGLAETGHVYQATARALGLL